MIYGAAIRIRNWLYDKRVLKFVTLDKPVVSIGNITLGGTGKSPTTVALVQLAAEMGLKAGIVSRGYGRLGTEVLEVNVQASEAAALYGDEPVMMKLALPKVPIFVGARRSVAALKLLEKYNVDIIFADDAFQHRSLARDLDIVLIDATTPEKNYGLIPFGRARESVTSLQRADVVILTKSNLASTESRSFNAGLIEKYAAHALRLESKSLTKSYRSLRGDDSALKAGTPVFAFSGLANNQNFFSGLQTQFDLRGHQGFSDHFRYGEKDLNQIIHMAKKLGASDIVTTAKDAVKIDRSYSQKANFWVADLQFEFLNNIEELKNEINQLAR